MEKGLIEISRYFGENREAVVYRNMNEERIHGMKTYQIHLYEGMKKLVPVVDIGGAIEGAEDFAEDFVTYKNED